MREASSSNRGSPNASTPPNIAWPASLTPLLGREKDTVRLVKLLHRPEVRLITITGAPGVGKTSLALHVARSAQESFADGSSFVALAPISDPTLIVPTIAQALNIPESPSRLALASLKEHLQGQETLVVVDNFEQVIAAGPMLTELLAACERLHLLVTSREALHVRGEQEYLLSPLILPDGPAIETVREYPSVALFVQRARAVQHDFRLTAENTEAVVGVCTQLDGLPLAIELAAARIKLFPPQALLEQLLAAPLELLTRGARDLPSRQQTLRRALRWSYDLLEDAEQRALCWYSVFVGGSTMDAALAVLGEPATIDVLESLVGKSLLRQIERGGAPRLSILATVREFGTEQLIEAEDLEAARSAHAAYYLSLAEEAELHLTGADQKAWLERLDVDRDNLRAALRWAIENREAELAMRMAGSLQPYWFTRGRWNEGRRWLEESLELDSDASADPVVQAKTTHGAGMLAFYQSDFARAHTLSEQSLALYRTLDDQSGVVMALMQLTRISIYLEDERAKETYLGEAALLVDALPDSVEKATSYKNMVVVSGAFGRYVSPEIARYAAESERLHRAFNNQAGLAVALAHQALLAYTEGDYALAASKSEEAERLAMELGDARVRSRVFLGRVLLDMREGDYAAARQVTEDVLRQEDRLRQTGDRSDHHLASGLMILAAIIHKQGLTVWTARVIGLAEAWGQSSLELRFIDEMLPFNKGLRSKLHAQMGEEAYAKELAAGGRLTLDDVLAIPHPSGDGKGRRESLTKREVEVLQLLGEDLTNAQIAGRLVISRRTVDAHLRSIYDKLGVRSRDAATRVAREQGLLVER